MEFHQTGAGHKFFERDVPELINSIGSLTKEIKRSNDINESQLSSSRAIKLINYVINNLSVGSRNKDVIQYLLYVGFSQDELVNIFNFDSDDIEDANDDMDGYICTLTL